MNGATRVLAFDFGASSGRAILATYDGENFSYEEIHRFENVPHEVNGHLCWNFDVLRSEVQKGIDKAGAFDSIGFDTWGVDFGLLDENGALLADPVHYRDRRTDGMIEKALKTMRASELYGKTGTQLIFFNTLFQLMALKEQQPELLEKAKTLLFMPDLFAYTLSGVPACERSIASTSQLLDTETGDWCHDILEAFGLPERILLPPVKSGSITGVMHNGAKVIAVAGHDTQCASAAVPTHDPNVAFLSCGTWSLLGTELDRPILSQASMKLGLSNELGANGRVNYLKNIIGLWLIQESRRALRQKGEEYSYADLERLALQAEPFRCFIDPDAPEFAPPGDIPERVREFCRRTGQTPPQTVGEVMRCIYESLALKYRYAVEQLRDATGKRFSALHILGGGTKDRLLCQMSANSTGLPVVAGPVEATALGNIIIQLVALGKLGNIDAGRDLIAATETLKHYTPAETQQWNLAYETFQTILNKGVINNAVS
ncbi:rhamnulokinase [Caproiciproducens sp. LBM24188]|nr:rhamnulokinase [Oscillospiraceae bacterium]